MQATGRQWAMLAMPIAASSTKLYYTGDPPAGVKIMGAPGR